MVFLLPLVFFSAAILPATQFSDLDGFYHYKIAQLIGSGKPWVDIRWLPYTVLGPDGPDHHWLFHVLIVPFTWIKTDILGLKFAIIVMAGLIPTALYLLLRKWQVPHPWLFALLALFGSLVAPWRFEMLRAQGLSVVLTCFFVYLLVQRRHVAMVLLVWFFFNSYYGAAITIPIALCFLAWRWWMDKPPIRTFMIYAVAVPLSLVLNPWFPKDFEYLFFHLLYEIPNQLGENTGGEWLPYPFKDFLIENALLHGLELILLLQTAQEILQKKLRPAQIPTETVIFVAMSALMFCAALSKARFIEYYAPLSAISSGLLLRDLVRRKESHPSDAVPMILQKKVRHAAVGASTLLLLVCMGRNLLLTPSQQIFDIAAYKPLAGYLEGNVPNGTLIFNSAYSDFPMLLWYTSDYSLANGLDTHYLAYGDPQRFQLWYKVTQLHQFAFSGMARSIAASFNTHWMLVHVADHDLAQYLLDSHQAKLRFTYKYGWLFEIEPT